MWGLGWLWQALLPAPPLLLMQVSGAGWQWWGGEAGTVYWTHLSTPPKPLSTYSSPLVWILHLSTQVLGLWSPLPWPEIPCALPLTQLPLPPLRPGPSDLRLRSLALASCQRLPGLWGTSEHLPAKPSHPPTHASICSMTRRSPFFW